MRKFTIFNNILVTPAACIWIAVSLLIVPINWIFAWIIAAAVHEFGHFIALRILKIPVMSLRFDSTGICMDADINGGFPEILTAILGPLCGGILLLFAKWIPRTAICAMLQCCFNLLPFSDFDGGRILRCTIMFFTNEKQCNRIMHRIQYAALLVLCLLIVYVGFMFNMLLISAYLICFLIFKSGILKIPCKQVKQIVQ